MASIDPMVEVYIYENQQLLEQLEELLIQAEQYSLMNSEEINDVFRIMHTIKGASAMMEFDTLTKVSHAIEDLFSFVREGNEPRGSDWASIFDLVLNAMDFIKAEITKIENGQTPDGEANELIDSLHQLTANLKKRGTGESAEPEAAGAPETSAAPAADAPQEEGGGSGDYYKAFITFEPGCQMEHVRAFGVINDITDMCTAITHVPEDVFGPDSMEQIAEHGFTIYLRSELPGEELQAKLSETLFLQDLDFVKLEADNPEIPASLKAANAEGEEPAAAAPEAAPAEEAAAQPAAEAAPAPAEEAPAAAQPAAPAPAPAAAAPAAPTAQQAQVQAAAEGLGASKQSFISVNISKLDKLMNLVGEIVTTESMVTRNPDLAGLSLDNFDKQAQQLRKLTDELQDVVMSIRMVPVSSTFHKMKRIVRDMSKKVNKDAQLVLVGEETEVDKNIIDNLGDPLMHIIRNSMDHGLETREDRPATGKPSRGTITLEARNTGGDVMIIITDDGRGLNRDKILAKAADRGLLTKPENEYSDKEVYNFIILPGFSTNDDVTEFSGRGVGMDVVRKNIEKIGGSMAIESQPGQGMTTTIKIPLTLAIMDGMLVSVGDTVFIVPVLTIRESFKPRMEDVIVDPDGTEMIMIRGECYPILRMHQHFNLDPKTDNFEEGIMIMVEGDNGTTCLFVDELIGETQAVVKPIPSFIQSNISSSKGLGGCTIMGDGSISLILDINNLIAM